MHIYEYIAVLQRLISKCLLSIYVVYAIYICWKTSPQRYYIIRLIGEISWQKFNQLDNFNRQSKFLKISLTTYIENKQYIEF